jgi:hypothetical protein
VYKVTFHFLNKTQRHIYLIALKKQIGRMSSGSELGSGHWKLSTTGIMLQPPSMAAAISCNVRSK